MSRSPRARCPARSPRTCPRHPPARAERLPGLRSPKGPAPPPDPLPSLRETKPTTSQVLVSAARHGRVWGTTTTSGPPWERALPVGAAWTSPSFKPASRRRRRRERELPQPTALQQRSPGEHFVQRSFLPAGVAPPLLHVNDSTRSFGGSCRWLLSTSPFATPGTSLVTPTTVTSAATSSSSNLGHGLTLGHISRGAVSGFCCPFPDADMGLTRSHGFFKRPAVFCIWFQSQVTPSHLERTQQ